MGWIGGSAVALTSQAAQCRTVAAVLLERLVSHTVVRRSGSTLHWAINGPDDIVDAVPGVRLLIAGSVFDADLFSQVSTGFRVVGKAMSVVPAMAKMAQYHRYAF